MTIRRPDPHNTPPAQVDLTWRAPKHGMAQVHLWAKTGHVAGLEAWQAAGGDLDLPWTHPDHSQSDGSTPLLFAVADTQSAAMDWLLRQPINVQAVNGRGRNALHLIAHRFKQGDRPEVDLAHLIAAGVHLNAQENEHGRDRDGDSTEGFTPLLAELNRERLNSAQKVWRTEHIRQLVLAGADLMVEAKHGFSVENFLGETALTEYQQLRESFARAQVRLGTLTAASTASSRKRMRS